MKFTAVFSAALVIVCNCTYSQNLVGYKYKEIRTYMAANRKDMNYNTVKNDKFRYLKYSDDASTQTALFFLSPDSVCISMRVICDLQARNEKAREFDLNFRKIGENKWIDKQNGKSYLIEIKDEKWSSIVTIEPDK